MYICKDRQLDASTLRSLWTIEVFSNVTASQKTLSKMIYSILAVTISNILYQRGNHSLWGKKTEKNHKTQFSVTSVGVRTPPGGTIYSIAYGVWQWKRCGLYGSPQWCLVNLLWLMLSKCTMVLTNHFI